MLSRTRNCNKCAQPVPKAVYRSGCRDKRNCPWCDSNLGTLTSQSDALTTRPDLRLPSQSPRSRAIQRPTRIRYPPPPSDAQTPLLRFVLDCVNLLYNKSTTDRHGVYVRFYGWCHDGHVCTCWPGRVGTIGNASVPIQLEPRDRWLMLLKDNMDS